MPRLASLSIALAAILALPAAASALTSETNASADPAIEAHSISIPDRETMQRQITHYRSEIQALRLELDQVNQQLDLARERIRELEASQARVQALLRQSVVHAQTQALQREVASLQERNAELERQLSQRPAPRVIAPAVDHGDADALNRRGIQFYTAGDYETAVPLFRQAAERDHPGAIANLAAAYLNGHAVPQDVQQAVTLLSRSSALGNVIAAENLGRMYEEAIGVGFDRSRSITWWARAQALGSTKADEALLRLRGPTN